MVVVTPVGWHIPLPLCLCGCGAGTCSTILVVVSGAPYVYVYVVLVVLSGVCGGAGVCGVYVCRCMVTPPQCDDHVSMSMGCGWGTFEFDFNNSRKDSAMSKEIRLVFAYLQERKLGLETTLLKVNDQIVQRIQYL